MDEILRVLHDETPQWLTLWPCQTFLTMNHDSRIKAKWLWIWVQWWFALFIYVLQGEIVSLMPNPQPVGPGYPFLSGSWYLRPIWHVTPYQQRHYCRQHSSQDHTTTQAPPLRQSRDTFGGVQRLQKCLNFHRFSKQNTAFQKHLKVKLHTWRGINGNICVNVVYN
jgi:hypothetical protein